ncbi:MAG: hypothetical protein GFH25_541324n36 [Chloroflexi bacterium AL-N10]|nr:hypothetical protein [Chloroflexi bacterium AL-N10]
MLDKFRIVRKYKENPTSVASISDFTLLSDGKIEASDALIDTNIGLYCLDLIERRAVFVHTDKQVNILHFPFVYMAQFDHARYITTLPLDEVNKLSAFSPYKNLIFIFTTGSSGSTLLKSIYGQCDAIVSVSEPDFISQLVLMRGLYTDEEIVHLIKQCMSLVYISDNNFADHLVVKFRGYCIELADLVISAFPLSTILFSYRSAIPQIESTLSMYNAMAITWDKLKADLSEMGISQVRKMIHLLSEIPQSFAEFAAISWASNIETYLHILTKHPKVYAVSYKALIENAELITAELFQLIGKPIYNLDTMVDAAFSQDSRQGTIFAKSSTHGQNRYSLSREEIERIIEVLEKGRTADFLNTGLPNDLI